MARTTASRASRCAGVRSVSGVSFTKNRCSLPQMNSLDAGFASARRANSSPVQLPSLPKMVFGPPSWLPSR